jgi:putative FmdB family regulatory protein
VPTYQYACTECDEQLEVRQSFTDDALTVCPECEGRLRKVFNAVGVVFKGSGFYRTDSRAEKTAANGQKSGDREAAKTDAGGSESSSKSGTAAATDSSGSSNGKSRSSHQSDSGSARSAGSGSAGKTAATA